MRFRAAGGAGALLTVGLVALTGCSSPSTVSPSSDALGLAGPWAQQFETAYASAKSDYEREILRDGEVTAAEYEQTKTHVSSCLRDAGYTISYDNSGGFELGAVNDSYPDDFFAKSDPILRKCEQRWEGSIRFLYEQVRRNPEQQDEATISVRCLRVADLVDESYSAKRWDRENESGHWSFDDGSPAAQKCRIDPLGLWYR